MVAYILLVCIGAVGGLGLVAMGRSALHSFRKDREQRARLAARQRLAAESRSREQVAVPEPHARGGLAAGTPHEQPAVAMPDAPPPPAPARERIAITHAAPPPMPLERGELTGVLNLLDESARFALAPSGDLPPPPARLPKATVAPAMPPVVEPMPERPAWADGVVPKRPHRQPEKPRTMIAPPPPPARSAKPSVPPPPPARFAGPNAAQAMAPYSEAPAAPRAFRQPSAAPHIAPSQPAAPTSLIRPPAPPPAQFARVTVGLPPARAPHASVPPPAGSQAPSTRIPVPPAPIHHAAPGQTRLPVPPLPPPPPPRRSRSS